MAVSGDEIVYVGDEEGLETYMGDKTREVDLDGGMVLPGFIDSHQHPAYTANELFTLSLMDCKSDTEYIDAIKKYYKDNPNLDVLVGYGWDRPMFKTVKQTKETLDEITTEIPIMISDQGFHIRWMNSKALEIMGITKDSKVPDGAMVEKDKNGEPTGVVSDYPKVADTFSVFNTEQNKEAILAYQEKALACGLTSSFEDVPRNFDEMVEAYQELEKEGKLKYRVNCFARVKKDDNIEEAVAKIKKCKEENKDGLFRISGAKLFIDGVLEGETAYMAEPYVNNPKNRGEYQWKGATKKLNQLCRALEKEDLNYHFHAIGDEAVSVALDAIEYAKKDAKDSVTRPGITHVQFVKDEDFKRFADLNVTAAIQAFWAIHDEYYDLAVDYVGKEKADQQYPIQKFFDNGVLVASGSDYPVQTDRPLVAIENGITRTAADAAAGEKSLPKDEEKATLEEMLQSYTLNGAIANGLENETGSLEKGKKADLVVLNKNLFEIEPSQISESKEMMTVFNGEVVYEAK